MSYYEPGTPLPFVTEGPVDPNNTQFKRAVSIFRHLGITAAFDLAQPYEPTIQELTSMSPVRSVDSFVGYEHFSHYGTLTGNTKPVVSKIFHTIINPSQGIGKAFSEYTKDKIAVSNAAIADFYQELNITIKPRSQVGLPELPAAMVRSLRAPAILSAISVRSVISIAQHRQTFTELVSGIGTGNAKTIDKIAALLQDAINGTQLTLQYDE